MEPKLQQAIDFLKQGRMIIITDHEDRENEGDLVMAAQFADADSIHFMAREGRGLICTPLTQEKAQKLKLTLMATGSDLYGTAFTQSIDHVGAGTGISAPARSLTCMALADPAATPEIFRRPGHIFPLIARPGGVLERPGHTEASVDLMKMAGLEPVAVICEILADDGTMARGPQITEFAQKHGLPVITLDDVIRQRTLLEAPVRVLAESQLPTKYGVFTMRMYENCITGEHHPVLISEKQAETPLVRVHSECMTGDTFGSLRCDCGDQLHAAMARIAEEGGALVYLRQEGRGIGLTNKIRAYALQEQGADTAEANRMLGFPEDSRDYRVAAAILKDLGFTRIRLLTNNPDKENALSDCGIQLAEIQRLQSDVHPINLDYMTTKRDHFQHALNF